MDWGASVRPLLAASYGNVASSELLKLARTIINCQQELMNHSVEYAPFYSSVVALSTHFISANIENSSRWQWSTFTAAARILTEYLMKKLDITQSNSVIGPGQLILLVKCLCNAQGCLSRSDVITLAARMKSSQLPPHIRSTIGPDKGDTGATGGADSATTDHMTATSPSAGGSPASVAAHRRSSSQNRQQAQQHRQRSTSGTQQLPLPSSGSSSSTSGSSTAGGQSDPLAVIYDFCLSPIVESRSQSGGSPQPPASTGGDGQATTQTGPGSDLNSSAMLSSESEIQGAAATVTGGARDVKKLYTAGNVQTLARLDALGTLFTICAKQPELSRYLDIYEQQTTHLSDRMTEILKSNADETSVQQVENGLQTLTNEIDMVNTLLELPIECSYSVSSLEKMLRTIGACVTGCALAVACRHRAEITDETDADQQQYDVHAYEVCQKTLKKVLRKCDSNVRRSTSVDQAAAENFQFCLTLLVATITERLWSLVKTPSLALIQFADSLMELAGPLLAATKHDLSARSESVPELNMQTNASCVNKFGYLDQQVALLPLLMRICTDALDQVIAIETDQHSAVTTEYVLLPTGTSETGAGSAQTTPRVGVEWHPLGGGPQSGGTCDTSEAESRIQPAPVSATTNLFGSSVESDDTPIIGSWLEAMFSMPKLLTAAVKANRKSTASESYVDGLLKNCVPRSKKHWCSLALRSLQCVNLNLLTGPSPTPMLRGICQTSLGAESGTNWAALMAKIVKQMDKLDDFPSAIVSAVSQQLTILLHDLLLQRCMNEQTECTLIRELTGQDLLNVKHWPLYLTKRTLAVVAQSLFLRLYGLSSTSLSTVGPHSPQRGVTGPTPSEELLNNSEAAIIVTSIWDAFVAGLTESVVKGKISTHKESHDVNVEHIQLLLVMFHALDLIPKKMVFMRVCQSLIEVGQHVHMSDTVWRATPAVGHLLLIFDYLLKHFYEPPTELSEQVRHNLFASASTPSTGPAAAGATPEKSSKKSKPTKTTSTDYITFGGLEHYYRAQLSNSHDVLGYAEIHALPRPTFYELCRQPTNSWPASDHEHLPVSGSDRGPVPPVIPPKLDGLALKFLVSAPDYPAIYNGVLQLMRTTVPATVMGPKNASDDENESTLSETSRPKILDFASVYYTRCLAYRVLSNLPLPISEIQRIQQKNLDLDTVDVNTLLEWLRVTVRLSDERYRNWQKDVLLKQVPSMKEFDAANLISSLHKHLTTESFIRQTADLCLARIMSSWTPNSIDSGSIDWLDVTNIGLVLWQLRSTEMFKTPNSQLLTTLLTLTDRLHDIARGRLITHALTPVDQNEERNKSESKSETETQVEHKSLLRSLWACTSTATVFVTNGCNSGADEALTFIEAVRCHKNLTKEAIGFVSALDSWNQTSIGNVDFLGTTQITSGEDDNSTTKETTQHEPVSSAPEVLVSTTTTSATKKPRQGSNPNEKPPSGATKSDKDTVALSASACLHELHATQLKALTVWWHSYMLESLRNALDSAELLLCDMVNKTGTTESAISTEEIKSALLSHLFSPVLRSTTADKVHETLTELSTTQQNHTVQECESAETIYFTRALCNVLITVNKENHSWLFEPATDKLARLLRSDKIWAAVMQYLQSDAGQRVMPRLLESHKAGQFVPFYSMQWIELVTVLLDPVGVDSNNRRRSTSSTATVTSIANVIADLQLQSQVSTQVSLCAIRRAFLWPLLRKADVLAGWLRVLRGKVHTPLDEKASHSVQEQQKNAQRTLVKLLEAIYVYLRSCQKDDQIDSQSARNATNLVVTAIVEELLSDLTCFIGVPQQTSGGTLVPISDRWKQVTATPASMANNRNNNGSKSSQVKVTSLAGNFHLYLTYAVKIAELHGGQAHLALAKKSHDWLAACEKRLCAPEIVAHLRGNGNHNDALETSSVPHDLAVTCSVLAYLTGLVQALHRNGTEPTQTGKRAETSTGQQPTTEQPGSELNYDSDYVIVHATDANAEDLLHANRLAEKLSGGLDDDSGAEDSTGDAEDENEALNNTLCTFTVTQKEFMNQHWYHCHTCGMVDGEGVCTVCAKVCHKDHDLSYSKFGSFFCDCGARQADFCRALSKRQGSEPPASLGTKRRTSAARRTSRDGSRPSSSSGASKSKSSSKHGGKLRLKITKPQSGSSAGSQCGSSDANRKQPVVKYKLWDFVDTFDIQADNIDADVRKEIGKELSDSVCQRVLNMLSVLLPAVSTGAEQRTPTAVWQARSQVFDRLHHVEKQLVVDEDRILMVHEHGSSSGVIDGLKANFTGDQAQTIRHLTQSQYIQRKYMALCELRDKNKQFVVVAHDRTKVSIIQCSSLVSQLHANKKKLAITRCMSESMLFNVLTVSACADCLAVTGLKDCHVMQIGSGGTVIEKFVLATNLDTGNYVVKVEWCEQIRGLLALITGDFVSIYNLCVDATKPLHQLVLPVGNVRDATFKCREKNGTLEPTLLILSSLGQIYAQPLDDSCVFDGTDPFYVTESWWDYVCVFVDHPLVTEVDGTVLGGGVSIHYSHLLCMLCVAYQQGTNVLIPFQWMVNQVTKVFLLPTLRKSSEDSASKELSLTDWRESSSHPGLLTGIQSATGIPIVCYFGPTALHIQALNQAVAKTKPLDRVLVPSLDGDPTRTGIISVCEDGSLQYFCASSEHWLDFWMLPPAVDGDSAMKTLPGSHPLALKKSSRKRGSASQNVTFPVDFFESCQLLTDVEFGGSDLLSRYDAAQLKNRLSTSSSFVACPKSTGFELQITVREANMVPCGIRVELGRQSIDKYPTYIEVFGRRRLLQLVRARWYDIPLQKDEAVAATRGFTVKFGPSLESIHQTSNNPEGSSLIVVDSVRVHGKTKEQFGWSDELYEMAEASVRARQAATVGPRQRSSSTPPVGDYPFIDPSSTERHRSPGASSNNEHDVISHHHLPFVPEVTVMCGMQLLRAYFDVLHNGDRPKSAVDLTTSLLCSNLHPAPIQTAKSVLRQLFTTKAAYYDHIDHFLLSFVHTSLEKVRKHNDADLFVRLLLIARDISARRATNFVKFSTALCEQEHKDKAPKHGPMSFLQRVMSVFWHISQTMTRTECVPALPANRTYTRNQALLVRCVIGVLHTFVAHSQDQPDAEEVTKLVVFQYSNMLLATNDAIRSASQQALSNLYRSKVLRFRKRHSQESKPTGLMPPPTSSPRSASPPDTAVYPAQQANRQATLNILLEHIAAQQQGAQGGQPGGPPDDGAPLVMVDDLMHEFDEDDDEMDDDDDDEYEDATQGEPDDEDFDQDDDDDDDEDVVVGNAEHNDYAQQLQQMLANAMVMNDPTQNAGAVPAEVAHDDDVAELELAIALSLQDNQDTPPPPPPQIAAQVIAQPPIVEEEFVGDAPLVEQESAHLSDTTASGGYSDDEVPRDNNGMAQTSQSSLGMDHLQPTAPEHITQSTSTSGIAIDSNDVQIPASTSAPVPISDLSGSQAENTQTLLIASLLRHLIKRLPSPDNTQISGLQAVAFMQTTLMLLNELRVDQHPEHAELITETLQKVVKTIVHAKDNADELKQRTTAAEHTLLMLRFVSVLLSKAKSRDKSSFTQTDKFLATETARLLKEADVIEHCRVILCTIKPTWIKDNASFDPTSPVDELPIQDLGSPEPQTPGSGNKPETRVLSRKCSDPIPDLSPFFLPPYVKEHWVDLFECYNSLLPEMALRIPYQIYKVAESWPGCVTEFIWTPIWHQLLCEYVSVQEGTFVRRQARKLLMVIAGGKNGYRQVRDLHMSNAHLCAVRALVKEGARCPDSDGEMPFAVMNQLMERLKILNDIATSRPVNWLTVCHNGDLTDEHDIMSFLLRLANRVPDVISSVVVDLIRAAVCPATTTAVLDFLIQMAQPTPPETVQPTTAAVPTDDANQSAERRATLIGQILACEQGRAFETFTQRYLLECNVPDRRWQVHGLVYAMFEGSSPEHRQMMLSLLRDKLWPMSDAYGVKANQLIDLIGVFTLKSADLDAKKQFASQVMQKFTSASDALQLHANANLYSVLGTFVDMDVGFYLESNPCLVCNNPELPMTNVKLNAVRLDSRSTTSSQVVKMVGTHEIAKLTIKFSDIKRTKMVKQLNVYYNNKTVSSAVDLKNKPEIWSVAKRVTLSPGQSEVKVEFPVPIVACNMMLEFADFYEVQKNASEMLHCPRCSSTVPANPGVCNNCGENVFQCHKCRSINYDEKDPFLCYSCGFSKYAKFDVTLTARQIATVETIENEEDRTKCVQYIDSLLDKADATRAQLRTHRTQIETWVVIMRGMTRPMLDYTTDSALQSTDATPRHQSPTDTNITGFGQLRPPGLPGASLTVGSMPLPNIGRLIKDLSQRYSKEAKLASDELARTVQRIVANRQQLLRYDSRHEQESARGDDWLISTAGSSRACQSGVNCYGCMCAQLTQTVQLLRALASVQEVRDWLIEDGADRLLAELMRYMRTGPRLYSNAVKALICGLCINNVDFTQKVCAQITQQIESQLCSDASVHDAVGYAIYHPMQLLRMTFRIRDAHWEIRLRTAFKLLLKALQSKNPFASEHVTLPCMGMLRVVLSPVAANKPTTHMHLSAEQLFSWLKTGDPDTQAQPGLDFDQWRSSERSEALTQKYGRIWLHKHRKVHSSSEPKANWLIDALFCPSSVYTRAATAAILRQICVNSDDRKQAMIDVLVGCVDRLHEYGEQANEFLLLFRSLIGSPDWKRYLTVRGFVKHLGELITKDVDELGGLENIKLGTDLTRGHTIRALTDLLHDFLSVPAIRAHVKSDILGAVLNGYLGLRRLIVQRTKLVDEAQAKLLAMLEELTSGTEEETKNFMVICVRTAQRYSCDDMRTPVFIFERLCSIIHPEEKDVGDFLINIEKDAAQEDFLQGRMMGNPYSSRDSAMGPLMRDIKNKICRDCELIALLEDDSGMELLVDNKIISLDLPVSAVYGRLWQPAHADTAMSIVYRMRGLLGDATEEFIETLDTNKEEQVDEEERYKLARVLGECDGLEVMLERLRSVRTLAQGRALLTVLLKLFGFAVKIAANRQKLCRLGAVGHFTSVMQMVLNSAESSSMCLMDEIVPIIELLLNEASKFEEKEFETFSDSSASESQIVSLLSVLDGSAPHISQPLKHRLLTLLPNLTLGSQQRINALIQHFTKHDHLNYNQYDFNAHSTMQTEYAEQTTQLEMFCTIAKGIQNSKYGGWLKDRLIQAGVVKDATEYLMLHHPPLFKVGITIDSPEWKDFLSKPALKYVLRILAGLCQSHEPTQMLVAADCIPLVHRLEQISTEERLGSLSESLMEALKENPVVAKKIEQVRHETKNKKKQMAMAMRKQQLSQMGMMQTSKGHVKVTAAPKLSETDTDVHEDSRVVCSICREGYKLQPTKVLGAYTFTKRVNADDYDQRAHKTRAHSTVTHFNLVHFDCHQAAVMSARNRDEWESAMLHNANTKCNALMPLWGPEVTEASFAACLSRFNADVQQATNISDGGGWIHDLKLLLIRFVREQSFADETGGGAKESNVMLLPCMLTIALHVIVMTRSYDQDMKNLNTFLQAPTADHTTSAFVSEGAHYHTLLATCLLGPTAWLEHRTTFLKRLLVTAYARHNMAASAPTTPDWSVYKPYAVYLGLVDACYTYLFKEVPDCEQAADWPAKLLQHLRTNQLAVFDSCLKLLEKLDTELLPCASFGEFVDVLGILDKIGDPEEYLRAIGT